MQKVGRGKWDETNGVRKVRAKRGARKVDRRKVGREKWGAKSGASKVGQGY